MKIKVNLREVPWIIISLLVLNVNNSIFYIQNNQGLLIAIIAFVLFDIIYKKHVTDYFVKGAVGYLVPWFAVSILSFITALFYWKLTFAPYITQSTYMCISVTAGFLLAYYLIEKFGERAINIVVFGGFISYFTVMIRWVMVAGVPGCFYFLNNRINGISLEVHNLTYCLGIFFVYLFVTKKASKKYLIFLFALIFIGDKRACFLALFVSIIMYIIFSKFVINGKENAIIKIVALVSAAIALVWVALIKYGIIELLFMRFGINSMGRLDFWNYVSDAYTISPSFLGRSMFYSDHMTISKEYIQTYNITGGSTQIHNDVLRSYIGWGFIPFIYYYYNFLYRQPNDFVKKDSINCAWVCLSITLYSFLIYFFDNMISTANFNLSMFIVLLLNIRQAGHQQKIISSGGRFNGR